MARPLEALTAINLDDLVTSFGWNGRRVLGGLLRSTFADAARTFARHMLEFDEAVGRFSALSDASQRFLQNRYVRALSVEGRVHVPQEGPVLFLANHPGMMDTLSLFAAIGRRDLKIIAQRRPFVESLTNTAKHCFFIDDNLGKRVIAAHEVAAHLKKGGAVLSFPAGRIEPDPDLDPKAVESVNDWADSARFIVRMAPETQIIPVLVRGVVCKRTAHHWLTHLKRTQSEREKLAAALQLIAMVSRDARPTSVNVRFAPAVEVNMSAPDALKGLIADRMREMIVDVSSQPAKSPGTGGFSASEQAPQIGVC